MSAAFDAGSLERSYAFLDDCPEALIPVVVTMPIGGLAERVAGVRLWTEALLSGRLPPRAAWPPDAVQAPVRAALESMGVVRFCEDQPELVMDLMRDILAGFARGADQLAQRVAQRLRELERLERERLEEQALDKARKRKRKPRPIHIDEATMERLRAQAQREAASSGDSMDQDLLSSWGERARAWAAIADVFGDLGLIMGRGWDMARAVLKHRGWADLLRLRALVEQLPQLKEIVRALGRLQDSREAESVAEALFLPVTRIEQERVEHPTPHVPAETRGVERSGEIARMLPVEAAMLGHPSLRMLWHARRAERALMTYRVQGVEIELMDVERQALEEQRRDRPRPERGPIIVVMDTSGSMHGLPERVAKALVLEAVRTAHAEGRACLLYAYSGPGNIIEHQLDLSSDGLGRLLAFLGFTFGGGNDEIGVMRRVVDRLEEQGWKKADVMWVSDGEWPTPQGLIRAVDKARERGTRFHGVQIGNRGRTGLHAICDPVHVFQDWAAAVGW